MGDPTAPPKATVGPSQSSPLKPGRPMVDPASRSEWSEYVYSEPDIVKSISSKEMIAKLCPHVHEDLSWGKAAKSQKCNTSPLNIVEYLNELSVTVSKTKPTHRFKLFFIETRSDAPKDHPTGTICRPDFVGYRREPRRNLTAKTIKWSQIQVTGEIFAKGDTNYDTRSKAGSYAAFNLQARPDLVSGTGLCVKGSDVSIYFINASRIYTCDTTLSTRSGNVPRLIYAFMWNLYHPRVDPSFTLDLGPPPVFSLEVTPDLYKETLSILRVGDTLGRRTMILEDPKDPSLVIKEQYIQPQRRFREGALLDKIHANGSHFPGIVRHGYHGEVCDTDGKVISTGEGDYIRVKTRLVLLDKGKRFAEIETPREMLMIAYDALEVIRILHRTRHILHRDISSGNILFRPLSEVDPEFVPQDIGDMCFSHYLLESLGLRSDESQSSTVKRLGTSLLLADFDSAQDKMIDDADGRMARTGTSMYMAIAVRNNGVLPAIDEIPCIPAVHEDLLPRYRELLPDRLEHFPENESEIIKAKGVTYGRKFEHILRYDVESVFWCMVWWLLQARPEGSEQDKLQQKAWQNLIGAEDSRYDDYIVSRKRFPFHPDYIDISPLLESMREHLRIDLEFSKDKIKQKEPEYLCEVFQRLILNFLVEHRNAEFLWLPKDIKWRDIEGTPMGRAINSQ